MKRRPLCRAVRGRIGRPSGAVMINPGCVGIGLDEDKALLIRHTYEAKCIGSGMVVIIDWSHLNHSNISNVEEGDAVCIENLVVHILISDNGYLIKENKFQPSKDFLRVEKHLI